jgi:hypothetical protein
MSCGRNLTWIAKKLYEFDSLIAVVDSPDRVMCEFSIVKGFIPSKDLVTQ